MWNPNLYIECQLMEVLVHLVYCCVGVFSSIWYILQGTIHTLIFYQCSHTYVCITQKIVLVQIVMSLHNVLASFGFTVVPSYQVCIHHPWLELSSSIFLHFTENVAHTEILSISLKKIARKHKVTGELKSKITESISSG